jgi:hypothetical protein
MNYFFDCEYHERGYQYPIDLISIGIVAEDDRKFYGESNEVDLNSLSPWLKENVVPHLSGPRLSRGQIASGLINLVAGDPKPVFWGYFVSYDWVLFCQLFGRMIELPGIFPGFPRDLRQELSRIGFNGHPKILRPGPAHNALADAEWNKLIWQELIKK